MSVEPTNKKKYSTEKMWRNLRAYLFFFVVSFLGIVKIKITKKKISMFVKPMNKKKPLKKCGASRWKY